MVQTSEKIDEKTTPPVERKLSEKAGSSESKTPIPPELKERLDSAIRVSLDVDDRAGAIGQDLAALKSLALKGLLSEIKDENARGTMSKLIEGFDLSKATAIIGAFQQMLPQEKAVGGIPVGSTPVAPQPFSCVAYSNAKRNK